MSKIRLQDVASIQFGCYAQATDNGSLPYLQARNFNELGQYLGFTESLIEDNEKIKGNLLNDGDVLFVSKGFRYFAALYKKEFGKAVASSIFFIIKPDKSKVIPAYLASVLNMPKNLLYFQQSGAGSSIPSIRKNELTDFTFTLLPIEQQQQVVTLQDFFLKDIGLSENLLKQKHILYQSTLSKIIK